MQVTPAASNNFHAPLLATIKSLTGTFQSIPESRKEILQQLTTFVETKACRQQKIDLVFICTHNSRRSHISQIWAQAAAAYFGIPDVASYSGGTEATAFNPRAVKAMEKAGFVISKVTEAENPVYEVSYSQQADPVIAFSKRYDADTNPGNDFAAIMTCSHADENCPVVSGMAKRISLPYFDPKDYDGTNQEEEKYLERVFEIGREILFAFSRVETDRKN